MVEYIGHLGDELASLRRWAETQPLAPLLRTAFAPGRLERWYGTGIDVVRNTLVRGAVDPAVQALGARFLPTWNSAILFRYDPGVRIGLHLDPSCFAPWAAILNLGRATFVEQTDLGPMRTVMEDGAAYRFRTDHAHGVEPVPEIRYALLFRQIRPEYLTLALEEEPADVVAE